MKSYRELKTVLRSRYLAMLSIHRYVESHGFEKAYNLSNDEEKMEALDIIEQLAKDELVKWTRDKLRENHVVDNLNMGSLRQLGRELGIHNYRTLTKLQLLSAISERRDGYERFFSEKMSCSCGGNGAASPEGGSDD